MYFSSPMTIQKLHGKIIQKMLLLERRLLLGEQQTGKGSAGGQQGPRSRHLLGLSCLGLDRRLTPGLHSIPHPDTSSSAGCLQPFFQETEQRLLLPFERAGFLQLFMETVKLNAVLKSLRLSLQKPLVVCLLSWGKMTLALQAE